MSLSSYECHEDMYTERSTLPKGVNNMLLLNYIFSPDFGINRQRKPPQECMKCFFMFANCGAVKVILRYKNKFVSTLPTFIGLLW